MSCQKLAIICALLSSVLLVSCQTKKSNLGEVRAQIEQGNARFVEAIKANDVDAIAKVYADNAIIVDPGRPILKGVESIKASLGPGIKNIADAKVTSNYFDVSGDLAYESGIATFLLRQPDGTIKTDKIKFLTVWKKQPDGSWKIAADATVP